jgi:hypothetical protein
MAKPVVHGVQPGQADGNRAGHSGTGASQGKVTAVGESTNRKKLRAVSGQVYKWGVLCGWRGVEYFGLIPAVMCSNLVAAHRVPGSIPGCSAALRAEQLSTAARLRIHDSRAWYARASQGAVL